MLFMESQLRAAIEQRIADRIAASLPPLMNPGCPGVGHLAYGHRGDQQAVLMKC